MTADRRNPEPQARRPIALYIARQGEEDGAEPVPGFGRAIAQLVRSIRREPGARFVVWGEEREPRP
jgi:hypothetical protein